MATNTALKRRRSFVVAVVVLTTLAVAAPAQATTKQTEVSGVAFNINGGEGSNVFGSIFSTDERCMRGRKVILQAIMAGGETRNMGHDKASKNGAVNVVVPSDPDGLDRYEWVVPTSKPSRKLKCGAARGLVFPA